MDIQGEDETMVPYNVFPNRRDSNDAYTYLMVSHNLIYPFKASTPLVIAKTGLFLKPGIRDLL